MLCDENPSEHVLHASGIFLASHTDRFVAPRCQLRSYGYRVSGYVVSRAYIRRGELFERYRGYHARFPAQLRSPIFLLCLWAADDGGFGEIVWLIVSVLDGIITSRGWDGNYGEKLYSNNCCVNKDVLFELLDTFARHHWRLIKVN